MPRRACGITYCEGLPGLGKTTAVIGLAAGLPQVAMVAENNPLPADHTRVAGLDPEAAARWYLHAERHRSTHAARLADRLARHGVGPGRPQVVCDKGALATLAYVHAASTLGQHPAEVYRQVRDLYLRRVRPHLSADATTIVFTGTVDLGLQRRRHKPDRALRPLWYDPRFLDALSHFYSEQAPDLVTHRLLRLDAATDQTQLRHALAAALDLPEPAPPDELAPRDYRHLPPPFRQVAIHVGPAVLGQALGRPFRQLTGTAQAFERHLLLAPGPGRPVRLQAQDWTPTTSSPRTGHRRPAASPPPLRSPGRTPRS